MADRWIPQNTTMGGPARSDVSSENVQAEYYLSGIATVPRSGTGNPEQGSSNILIDGYHYIKRKLTKENEELKRRLNYEKCKVIELEGISATLEKKMKSKEEEWTNKWEKMKRLSIEQDEMAKQCEKDLRKKHEQIVSDLKKRHTCILDEKNEEIKGLRSKVISAEHVITDLRNILRSHEQTADDYKNLKESFATLMVKCSKLEIENDHILRKMKELEGEVKRSKSDVNKLLLAVRDSESEKEQLRKDIQQNMKKAMDAEYEFLKHNHKLEEKAQLECKSQIEEIKNEFSVKMDELNFIIRKQADDKFRMREEHSKEMESLRSQNSEVIACIRSSHEGALKEKDEAFRKCARRIVRVEEKCTQDVKKMMAVMKEDAERIRELYEQFMRTNDKHSSDVINRMYEKFKQVTDKQAEQLLHARKKERIFTKILKEMEEKMNLSNDLSEDENSGVEIEEVFDEEE